MHCYLVHPCPKASESSSRVVQAHAAYLPTSSHVTSAQDHMWCTDLIRSRASPKTAYLSTCTLSSTGSHEHARSREEAGTEAQSHTHIAIGERSKQSTRHNRRASRHQARTSRKHRNTSEESRISKLPLARRGHSTVVLRNSGRTRWEWIDNVSLYAFNNFYFRHPGSEMVKLGSALTEA